jgi:uncharacterized protein YcbK (DUF882 family)
MRYRYFTLAEFACRCGCKIGKMNPLLIALLDNIRAQIKLPITVQSGIRCIRHNAHINGRSNSLHIPDLLGISNAADISCADIDNLFAECSQTFLAIGDGRDQGFIHVDMRPDKKRLWKY